MDKETEQFYRNYFDLFATEGWKQFVAELTKNVEQMNNARTIQGNEELRILQGQLSAMDSIIGLETQTNAVFEELTKPVPDEY